MDKEDHLSNEISILAKLEEKGVRVGIRSRFASSFDRLLGALPDWMTSRVEGDANANRATDAADIEIQKAAVQKIIEKMDVDDDLVNRALQGGFIKSIKKQKNKESVILLTADNLVGIENIENKDDNEEELSEEFINRFEKHAEEASDEDARQKWANVLAAEIVSPGSITNKTMRIIDEIDSATANAFADMGKYRIGDCIPIYLYNLHEYKSRFLEYDLINDNFLGFICRSVKGKVTFNGEVSDGYIFNFGNLSILVLADSLTKEVKKSINKVSIIDWDDKLDTPSIRIISLTQTGKNIIKFGDDNSFENAQKLVSVFKENGIIASVVKK